MSSLIDIASGWYHFIHATPETRQLMTKRLAICDECPHKVQMSETGKKIMTTINKEASVYRCGLCYCPLAARTANPNEKCPLGKW